MLRLTPETRDHMFAYSLSELPIEACGMLSAKNGSTLVDVFHPMRNAAASATVFQLDGQEMLDLERSLEGGDREIVGVVHSHTVTSAYPSPTDTRDAARFDPAGTLNHIIVSLRHAEPVLRGYRILGQSVIELPVVVTDGDDLSYGDDAAVAAVMTLPTR